MITVHINGLGTVQAILLQTYPDGDMRVSYHGQHYIVRGERPRIES